MYTNPFVWAGNDGAVLARSVGKGNILWRSWTLCGALTSPMMVCIIYVEDGDQDRVERFGGWKCWVWCILN